ncbi:ABC transporter permease [Liquorilactobacillus vini]|uniref:ABC transporter permease n=1 Tax=Liquorilactobacillus vini DSM 20605 TaxID=1133569 RepID=A0A0R2BWD5_9LACO|nr:ABC transporter permease [Liquorilactobacillus vini]KRM83360.1 ABC transporter permease [Liquorilactobacillus vini DSM 20605]
MNKYWIVTSQVYRKNLKSGSWLSLVLSPLILLAIVIGIGWYVSQSDQPAQVAVVTDNPAIAQTLKKANDADIHYQSLSAAQAKRKLKHESITGILTIKTEPDISAKYVELANAETSADLSKMRAALTSLKTSQAASRLKLTSAQLQALTTPAQVQKKTVAIENGKQVAKSNSASAANYAFATGLTIFIMLIITVYGQMLAQEIATEKGSRIMEILLSSVSATTQFFAKLTAILLLLVTQLAIYVIAGGLSWTWLKQQSFVEDILPAVDLSVFWSTTSLMAILFFIIGTMTFAVLAALLGSLVANQEQVNTAVMPISLLALAGYFLSLMAQAGDSMLIKVFSYIPFINVELMPVRLALQHTTLLAAGISLVIAVIFLIVFTFIVVKVYQTNVLVYSEAGIIKAIRQSFRIWQAEWKK